MSVRRPYAVRRRVENTYLVRQRDRRRRRELFGVLVAVLLVGGGLLSYTWVHVAILHAGYRVEELARELEEMEQEERRRRLAVSRLTTPERVEARARGELAMRPPALEQTVFAQELGR